MQITDRIKDVIKTGGEWVSSLQLEDIIAHSVGVAEVAVICIKDDKWGERPIALVVRDPGGPEPATEEGIKAHVMTFAEKGIISRYGVPQKILFIDQIAKTSVGKINKKELRELYGNVV